jgi:hypothetical protein
MTKHEGLPVKGYVSQSPENVALANEGKELEERYLRWLDKLTHSGITRDVPKYDQRFVALARTNIQQGAMWAIRSIFQPQRIALPEDGGDK